MQLKVVCVMKAPRQGAIADANGAVTSGTVYDLRFQVALEFELNPQALGQVQAFPLDFPGVREEIAATYTVGGTYFLDLDAVH